VAINRQLEKTLEEAVADMGYEWVGCEWTGGGGQGILRIYIDTSAGVGLDECAKVSRELGAILDVEDFAPTAYRLELSSPGVERPLFRLEHYAKQLGKRVSLRLRVPDSQGRRRFKGVIESVDGPKIRVALDESDEILELACSQVEKAKLVVDI
jgi:ribosome maturation factor RimP